MEAVRVLSVDYGGSPPRSPSSGGRQPGRPWPVSAVRGSPASPRRRSARRGRRGRAPAVNLSAVVCPARRGRPGPPSRPSSARATSPRSSRSYELFRDGFYLCEGRWTGTIAHYLRRPLPGGGSASPLRVRRDLSGLPPAYVPVAGFDPLRDRGRSPTHSACSRRGSRSSFDPLRLIHGFINHERDQPGRERRHARLAAVGLDARLGG